MYWLEDRGQAYPFINPDLAPPPIEEQKPESVRRFSFVSDPVVEQDEKLMATRMLQALNLKKEEFCWIRVDADLSKLKSKVVEFNPQKVICFGEHLARYLTNETSFQTVSVMPIVLNGRQNELLIIPQLKALKANTHLKAKVWNLFQNHLL